MFTCKVYDNVGLRVRAVFDTRAHALDFARNNVRKGEWFVID